MKKLTKGIVTAVTITSMLSVAIPTLASTNSPTTPNQNLKTVVQSMRTEQQQLRTKIKTVEKNIKTKRKADRQGKKKVQLKLARADMPFVKAANAQMKAMRQVFQAVLQQTKADKNAKRFGAVQQDLAKLKQDALNYINAGQHLLTASQKLNQDL